MPDLLVNSWRFLAVVLRSFCLIAIVIHGPGLVEAISVHVHSEHEDNAFNEFRELTGDLTYREFMRSDAYLIRWLRETDFEVYEALNMFTKFVEWRRENNIDSIVFEDFSTLDEELQNVVHGFDKDGRVVFIAPFGTYDIRKIGIAGEEKLYQRFLIRMYELGETYLYHLRMAMNHPNATQLVTIYDMAGFNLKLGGCFKCISMIPEYLSNVMLYYPQLTYKNFLINTPKIFDVPLKIGLNLMSAKYRESLEVYGHDKSEWLRALHRQIPIAQLPAEFGGIQPSYRARSAKKAQLRFTTDLVAMARESVRRDLGLSGNDSDTCGHDKRGEFESSHQHHHHHFRVTNSSDVNVNTRLFVPSESVVIIFRMELLIILCLQCILGVRV